MHDYLNWWIAGLALGGLTVVFRLLTGRALGVSGSWKKVVFWRQESRNDKTAVTLTQNQGKTANALLAATLAEFGEGALTNTHTGAPGADSPATERPRIIPWTAHLLFLLCMMLGGFIWAAYTGHLQYRFELSTLHNHITGAGWKMGLVLLTGGFLVGFGTQMAGGCSSGHGLSGCANFSFPSILATAGFFTTAVLVSLFIKIIIP